MENKEWLNTEYKEGLDEENIIKTLTAFANTKGGTVYVGVTDAGIVKGAGVGKGKLEHLVGRVNNEIKPSLYPEIEKEKIDKKEIIKISVSESNQKPHMHKGVVYKRVGKNTIAVTSPDEILNILSTRTAYDSKIVEEATIDDLDRITIDSFVKLAERKGRMPIYVKEREEVLEKLGLVKAKKITLAALVMFGKNPTRFIPNHGFKCALLRWLDIIDIQDYNENFFECVEAAMNFATKYVKKKVKIEGLIRREEYLPPYEALRESVINAAIHRDYTIMSSNYLSISEEGVEIKNPGALIGLEKEDLKKAHSSITRNPLMAKVAYLSGYIEKWGIGTIRITDTSRSVGIEPDFEEKGGFFTVRFPYREIVLNKRQKNTIKFVEKEGYVKASKLAVLFGVSLATAKRDLDRMVGFGLLKKSGKARSSMYKLA